MSVDEKKIKEGVRQIYGGLAERYEQAERAASCCPAPAGSNCCGSKTATVKSSAERLYSAEEVADLPDSVTNFSLGCGNPLALAELRPGEVVLDLGSGGGLDCFLAARSVGPAGRVIGLDITPQMIDLARRNAARIGADNVEFRLGEMEDMPVEDDAVDVVISNCVINLSSDKGRVFSGVYRVLKPGGRLAVSDIVLDGQLPPVVAQNVAAWAGCIAGALQEADYLEEIRRAGFVEVEVTGRTYTELETIADSPDAQEFIQDLTRHMSVEELKKSLSNKVVSLKVTAHKPA